MDKKVTLFSNLTHQNWKEKWEKIKDFVKNKKNKGGKHSERDEVYNAILALYAGDDEEEVFSDLTVLYEKYP